MPYSSSYYQSTPRKIASTTNPFNRALNGTATTATTTDAYKNDALAKDVKLEDETLKDSISCLRWSPKNDCLASTSWDGNLRVFHVPSIDGPKPGVAMLTAGGPLLSCDWNEEGTMVAAGGGDKILHLLDVSSQQTRQLGAHDQSISAVRFVQPIDSSQSIVATGSWDKTVRYWDVRTNSTSPVAGVEMSERVYAMDTAEQMMAVSTADLAIHLIDLRKPDKIFSTQKPSLLQATGQGVCSSPVNQLRGLAMFPSGKGYAVGSIGGRVGIQPLDQTRRITETGRVTFKCHRDYPKEVGPRKEEITDVYPINDLCWHPKKTEILCTAGGDSTFVFWNRILKNKTATFPKVAGSLTSVAFNADGTLLAYAIGYDWSKGVSGNSAEYPVQVMLHPVQDTELVKR